MTREEIISNSGVLLVAGSETTATLLSGATYYILSNLVVLKKLQAEIRDAFQSEDEITPLSVRSAGKLPYMEAVLTESLRMYPPIPASLPRMTGSMGETIDGPFVPANVIASMADRTIQFPFNLLADIRRSASVGDLPVQRQFHRPQVLHSGAMATRGA